MKYQTRYYLFCGANITLFAHLLYEPSMIDVTYCRFYNNNPIDIDNSVTIALIRVNRIQWEYS